MMDNINQTQSKVTELNIQYMDVSTKLTLLQNHQLLIKLEYKSQQNDELINNEKINISCGNGSYNGSICICFKGYTYDDSGSCLYKQSKALTSLLIELFTNIGIGHMIIGRTLFGMIKLMLGVVPWLVNILGICSVIRAKPSEGVLGLIVSILLFASSFTFFVWWIVDGFLFGFNVYKDGNGKELEYW